MPVIYAKSFEVYLNDRLVGQGSGIFSENIVLPSDQFNKSVSNTIAFKFDTEGFMEPGFGLNGNILVGPYFALNEINVLGKVRDTDLVLWLILPKLAIALMFGFGALLFSFSHEYLFFIAFCLFSSLKIPPLYNVEGFVKTLPFLDRGNTINFFDLLAQMSLFYFVYKFFRMSNDRLARLLWIVAGLVTFAYLSVALGANSYVSFNFGYWLAKLIQGLAIGYGIYAAYRTFAVLRANHRSASRQIISAVILLLFISHIPVLFYYNFLSTEEWKGAYLIELSFVLIFAACIATDVGKVRSDRDNLRQKFGIFVDENIVNLVLSPNRKVSRSVDRATVMFIDICNFSEIADCFPPNEVVTLLSGYFDAIINIVHVHGGTVNKFIGDCIMAVWGLGNNQDHSALEAVNAALQIRKAISEMNQRRREAGQFAFSAGVAIHSGSVTAGQIGNERRAEYSIIGKTVNIAARLEVLTRELRFDVLVSSDVWKAVKEKVVVVKFGTKRLKGVDQPIEVFGLIGVREQMNGAIICHDPQLDSLSLKAGVEAVDNAPSNLVVYSYSPSREQNGWEKTA